MKILDACLGVLLAMSLATSARAELNGHVVDSIGDVGLHPIVRFAPDGLPVIAYLQSIPLTGHFDLP